MKRIITTLFVCLSALASVHALDHSHPVLDGLLGKYVKASGVNYGGLKGDSSSLNTYLDTLAGVSEAEFKDFTEEQQMAMVINLYNAATLKLVIEHYPVKSIREISASSGGPWKKPVVRFLGKMVTLDYLENDFLRPKYKDPRIHFAINCASIGCPDLRSDAFQASKLSSQMDEQTRKFLKDSSKNRVDAKAKTLFLSSIFDWFKSDFVGKSGSVEKFIAPYLSPEDRAQVEKGGLAIKYTEYSWSLNKS